MAKYQSRHDKSGGYHSKKYIEANRTDKESRYIPSEKKNYSAEDDITQTVTNDNQTDENLVIDETGENYNRSKKFKPLIIIIVILLILTVLGAGAFAAYHFMTTPEKTEPTFETVPAATNPATKQEATKQEATKQEASTEAPDNKDEKYLTAARKQVESMTKEEKIYQMFIVKPEVITGVDVATLAGDATKDALTKYPVGGILLADQNIEDSEQITEMISNMQSYSKTPLFITVNEEGGTNSSCQTKLSDISLENMYSYKDKGEETAKTNAKTIADSISKLGFNFNLAPVTDVWSNTENSYMGERCYTDDYEMAMKLIPAAINGFHEGKIITSVKYFPGTGNAVQDSQTSFPHLNMPKEQITSQNIKPFEAAITAGTDTITIGNVILDQIDSEKPATMSEKIVPSLLRENLKYDGLIMSDSIQSSPLTENYSAEEIVKGMINSATIDIIVDPDNIDSYYTAVDNAITNGDIKESTIDESVIKIIALKMKYGLIKTN